MPEPMFSLTGKRVYVAGHRGMVGQALVRALEARGIEAIVAAAPMSISKIRRKPKRGLRKTARRSCCSRPRMSAAFSRTTLIRVIFSIKT